MMRVCVHTYLRVLLMATLAFATVAAMGTARASADVLPMHGYTAKLTQQPWDSWGQYQQGAPGFTASTADDNLETLASENRAGRHPTLNLDMFFCTPKGLPTFPDCTTEEYDNNVKKFVLRLPPGMLANVASIPTCPDASFFVEDLDNQPCPIGTAVGWAMSTAPILDPFGCNPGPRPYPPFGDCTTNPVGSIGTGYIYNLAPQGNEVVRLGTSAKVQGFLADHYKIINLVRIVPDGHGQYVVESTTELPNWLQAKSNPTPPLSGIKIAEVALSIFGSGGVPERPIFVNPTHCPASGLEVPSTFSTYEAPTSVTNASSTVQITDCDQVPFDPQIEVAQSDTEQAGAPAGYDVSLVVPGDELPVRQSHSRRVEVTLPQGVGLNPTAARGLEACPDDQFGLTNDAAVACPSGSRIGDISVETPYLDGDSSTPLVIDPLEGKVFFGEPKPGDPWRLFLLIDDANLRIKIAGSTHLDPATGRITSVFEDLPQTPFTRFTLSLRGGDRAILTNPRDCGGPHDAETNLTPWSGNADKHPSDSISVTGCPNPRGFAPQVSGSTNPTTAGAFTSSHIELSRTDTEQLLTGLDLSLPAGLAGSLAGIPLCPPADALAGTCSEDSKIATVSNAVGPGNAPLPFPGSIYLASPVDSADVVSLSVVVPAKVGPIDLGNVVLISHIRLRQADGGLDVSTPGIPTIFGGVPLAIRNISIDVNRPAFMRNPTGCDVRSLVAVFHSDEGASSVGSSPGQATNCDALPFAPKLRLIANARGQTKRFDHTGLTAIVSQNSGEANIASAEVLLPDILRPDNVPLNKPGGLCTDAELAARVCPGPSQVGSAVAQTPLLPQPLSGPVYVVQDPTNPLPKLAVLLNGMAAIELDAQNHLVGLRTRNNFDPVPDVPVSRFELNIKGGENGILKNFRDLCSETDTADAKFVSHSGKVHTSSPELEVDGCATSSGIAKLRIPKRARVDRKGRARFRLSCKGGRCKGKIRLSGKGVKGKKSFTIAAGKKKTVRVKLNRKGRRKLARKRRLKVRAQATLKGQAGVASRRSVRLLAPKKRRH